MSPRLIPIAVGVGLALSSVSRIYRLGIPGVSWALQVLAAAVGYGVYCALVLVLIRRLTERAATVLLCVVVAVAVGVFFALYPLVGPGFSDADEALDILGDSLVHHFNPYLFRTSLGNTLSPMMGAGVLAVPFRLCFGHGAYQNPAWVIVGAGAAWRMLGARVALAITIFSFSSLGFVIDYALGGDYFVSGIFLAIASLGFFRALESGVWKRYLAAVGFGMAVTDRLSTLPVLLIFVAVVVGVGRFGAVLGPLMVSIVTSLALWVPWWAADPAAYAPLQRTAYLGPPIARVLVGLAFLALLVLAAVGADRGTLAGLEPWKRLAVYEASVALALLPSWLWVLGQAYRVAPFLFCGAPLLVVAGSRVRSRASADATMPGEGD